MDKVKIMHCSDFHFDTPFSGFDGNIAEIRREDIRENFSAIISMAKENKIQILLMAGDLFDNASVSPETISLMQKRFDEIPEIKVFISPGNHDPIGEKSYYNIVKWPSNVYIFKNQVAKVELEELNTVVYGYGFAGKYEKGCLLKDFRVENHNKINFMVMHGEVVKGEVESIYNAIRVQHIENSGLDYLALGHVHSFSGINKIGTTYWSYSGCPEGRGFDELGEKGIVIGEVGKSYAALQFVKTCKRQNEVLKANISGSENYDDIILNINNALIDYKEKNDLSAIYDLTKKDIYKIVLEGEIDKDFLINTSVLHEKLKYQFYYVKVEDNTERRVDYKALANEYTLKGLFVKRMLIKIEAAVDEIEKCKLKKALRFGLDALELREVNLQ